MSPREATSADKALGLKIRTRRNAAGISQEALAAKLGITFQQVQKYEKGVNRVSANRLIDIAKALGEDISYFHGVGNITESMLAFNKAVATPHGVRLMKAFAEIQDTQKELTLIHMAEYMAELSAWQEGEK